MTPSQLPVVCDTTHEVWVSDLPISDDRTKAKLAHTFKAGESLVIGCHEAGHYQAGMKLPVTVS